MILWDQNKPEIIESPLFVYEIDKEYFECCREEYNYQIDELYFVSKKMGNPLELLKFIFDTAFDGKSSSNKFVKLLSNIEQNIKFGQCSKLLITNEFVSCNSRVEEILYKKIQSFFILTQELEHILLNKGVFRSREDWTKSNFDLYDELNTQLNSIRKGDTIGKAYLISLYTLIFEAIKEIKNNRAEYKLIYISTITMFIALLVEKSENFTLALLYLQRSTEIMFCYHADGKYIKFTPNGDFQQLTSSEPVYLKFLKESLTFDLSLTGHEISQLNELNLKRNKSKLTHGFIYYNRDEFSLLRSEIEKILKQNSYWDTSLRKLKSVFNLSANLRTEIKEYLIKYRFIELEN